MENREPFSANSPTESLWTAAQVASRLRVEKTRVYYLVRAGRLPCVRIGRVMRFNPIQIEEWLDMGGWSSPAVRYSGPNAEDR